ncbi:MAG: hypothetical protein ABIR62_00955 [Dokdonella sp.]|uniref:hypothetical protein n=1 Tax=Dokdonella sp. TaxID=2291710 RepID=UPI003265A230
MTQFDDFNLPLGPADEKLWNNATVTSTDARVNLFFINDQSDAHGGSLQVDETHHPGAPPPGCVAASGVVRLHVVVGNRSDAGWTPELMVLPVPSNENRSAGDTGGFATIDVATACDVPTPQGRYLRRFDRHGLPNGDHELFVQASEPSGLKGDPSLGNETSIWPLARVRRVVPDPDPHPELNHGRRILRRPSPTCRSPVDRSLARQSG